MIAMFVGILIGVALALPWRGLIRRRVQTRNIEELSQQLHVAIAELQSTDRRSSFVRRDPAVGIGPGLL